MPGEGSPTRLSHRGRSAVGRRRTHRHPEPGSGALRQRTAAKGAPPTAWPQLPVCRSRACSVRRLPGLDHPDGATSPPIGGVQASTLITQRMTAKMHRQLVTFTGAGRRALRLLPAADHGQDPLQAADGLPAPGHRQGSWPVLPALRPHDDDLGARASPIRSRARGLLRTRSSAKRNAVLARTRDPRHRRGRLRARLFRRRHRARPGTALARCR